MGDKVESRGELQAVKAPLGGQLAAIPPLFPLPIDYCLCFAGFLGVSVSAFLTCSGSLSPVSVCLAERQTLAPHIVGSPPNKA